MGDHGRLYTTYTDDMCLEMKSLVSLADIVTPNLTEACILTGTRTAARRGRGVSLRAWRVSFVRWVQKGGYHGDFPRTGAYELFIRAKRRGGRKPLHGQRAQGRGERAGTGDVFSSIVAADMVNGLEFRESVIRAGRFIARASRYSDELGVPHRKAFVLNRF